MHARACILRESGRMIINDGGRDAYWGAHAKLTSQRRIALVGRDRWWDACLRTHAKVTGGMG
jgi:hypothetical protein